MENSPDSSTLPTSVPFFNRKDLNPGLSRPLLTIPSFWLGYILKGHTSSQKHGTCGSPAGYLEEISFLSKRPLVRCHVSDRERTFYRVNTCLLPPPKQSKERGGTFWSGYLRAPTRLPAKTSTGGAGAAGSLSTGLGVAANSQLSKTSWANGSSFPFSKLVALNGIPSWFFMAMGHNLCLHSAEEHPCTTYFDVHRSTGF